MATPTCREAESKLLQTAYNSKKAQFIAIYGRRRVGKTHLVRELFQNREVYFELVGKKDATMHEQLENFSTQLSTCFFNNVALRTPDNWRDAFELLTSQLTQISKRKKIVVFFDELPWLASKRSNLLSHLDYYWNAHWTKLDNLCLIVCGSAATWMLDNIINAQGGLHNRITRELLVKPFNLSQTKKFLKSIGFNYSDKQILDVYLTMGGVPYYLKMLQRSKSISQNINDLCFRHQGGLYKEFEKLFASLFEKHQQYSKIIRAIAKKRYGISYGRLSESSGISSGGGLSRRLDALEKSGFISRFHNYNNSTKDEIYYRVVDEYSLFYLRWIEEFYLENTEAPHNYWSLTMKSPAYHSWAGYSFEMACSKHTDSILKALGIDNIRCKTAYWRFIPQNTSNLQGAQIDLLIDRDDGVITLVEIKHCNKQFVIDKHYARQLMLKIEVFKEQTRTRKQITLAMITSSGLKRNVWATELIDIDMNLLDTC